MDPKELQLPRKNDHICAIYDSPYMVHINSSYMWHICDIYVTYMSHICHIYDELIWTIYRFIYVLSHIWAVLLIWAIYGDVHIWRTCVKKKIQIKRTIWTQSSYDTSLMSTSILLLNLTHITCSVSWMLIWRFEPRTSALLTCCVDHSAIGP